MATNLNDKLSYTKSNKIRKVTVLKRIILEKINENQNIKRYMRYITKLPLARKSEDFDHNIKIQPDVLTSLMEDNDDGEQFLFGGSFNPEMDNVKIPYIFVHSSRSKVDGVNNTIYFTIYILCPERYNRLANYGEERIYEIADEIVQLLDEYSLENNDIAKEIGNLKFVIDGSFEELRMSKSNDIIILAVPVKVCNMTLRSRIK